MGYYHQRDNDCFGVGLANLLVCKGDTTTAAMVYKRYDYHPLRLADGGMYGLLATRLVRELTNESYEATMWVSLDGSWLDLKQGILPMYGERAEEVLRIILEERERGGFKDHQGIIEYESPAMIAVSGAFDISFHWLVNKEDDLFIDNGKERKFKYGIDRAYNVYGVLELVQKGRPQ